MKYKTGDKVIVNTPFNGFEKGDIAIILVGEY